MHWATELILFLFLIASAIAALELRDLLAAVVATSAFSFVIAAIYVAYGAVDVGFTEAVVGAGIVGVYYIATILQTTRRSAD